MRIDVFNESDCRKAGGFKIKNNVKTFEEDEFVSYVKENSFTLSKGYIDVTGFISDGSRFRCYHSELGLIIGVTGIIDKINGGN